jgi:two-component system, OmpR family, alkaline phosphatase synthesis response regulator PhoP
MTVTNPVHPQASPVGPTTSAPLSEQPSSAPADRKRPLTIVVAEDEPAIRLVLASKLKQAGYTVLPAANGEEALQIARSILPDLIITDFQMPRMDGLAMARILHESEATRSIPLIVLSARGHRLGSEDVGGTNVIHVLMKPFSMREVTILVLDSIGPASESGSPKMGEAA